MKHDDFNIKLYLEEYCDVCGNPVTSENAKLFDELGPILTVCINCLKKYNEVVKIETINTMRDLIK